MSAEPAEKKAKKPLVLGYWAIRGLAQPIRLLLKYCGMEFEDVRYSQGEPPNFSRESWMSVKNTLGLDFPNLPYLIDDDFKLTQSNAILAYIARMNNLDGSTARDKATVDMLANLAMDFRNGWVRLCYNKNMKDMQEEYMKNLPVTLKKFSDYLGNKPFFAGDELTYPDFVFYELLDQHKLFDGSVLNDFPNLQEFLDRFEALPAIKTYMESSDFHGWPVNSKIAAWGGLGEKPN